MKKIRFKKHPPNISFKDTIAKKTASSLSNCVTRRQYLVAVGTIRKRTVADDDCSKLGKLSKAQKWAI